MDLHVLDLFHHERQKNMYKSVDIFSGAFWLTSYTRGQYTQVHINALQILYKALWKKRLWNRVIVRLFPYFYVCVCVCCSEAAAHAVATLAEATLQGGGQIVLSGETAAAVGALTGVSDGSGTNLLYITSSHSLVSLHTHWMMKLKQEGLGWANIVVSHLAMWGHVCVSCMVSQSVRKSV